MSYKYNEVKKNKELINSLTDKILKQEGIDWKENVWRKDMKRRTPNFRKILPIFKSCEDNKGREFCVEFLFYDINENNNQERIEIIHKHFPFLKNTDSSGKTFQFDTLFHLHKVKTYIWGQHNGSKGYEIYGVVFGFDVYKDVEVV